MKTKKNYTTINDLSNKYGISARTIRNYCASGKIEGCIKNGKTWLIPEDAHFPMKKIQSNDLLSRIKLEKQSHITGGIYHKIQIELTYNSNHMEGSRLTSEETRYIYETNTIGLDNKTINVDDIIETVNHFKCVDYIIDHVNYKLTESMIKHLHYLLKSGTSDSRNDWFIVGDYKVLENEVGGQVTTPVENVSKEIKSLLKNYNSKENIALEDIIAFHYAFEKIHPFTDGNGRVGRLIMFKECLRNNITPFIIEDDIKLYYYRGLKEWKNEKGYLIETCLSSQDKFKTYLDYFKIPYKD